MNNVAGRVGRISLAVLLGFFVAAPHAADNAREIVA
jgi:hypothetical protein